MDDEKHIREIAHKYHVSLERARSIYYAHLASEKKRRRLSALERRSLGAKMTGQSPKKKQK